MRAGGGFFLCCAEDVAAVSVSVCVVLLAHPWGEKKARVCFGLEFFLGVLLAAEWKKHIETHTHARTHTHSFVEELVRSSG